MERSGNGRRKADRMALEPDEIALSQLFDGMQALNRRYERALKVVAVALAFAFLVMAAEGFLLYHSNVAAQHDRTHARQELARGTRAVARESCVRQNEHRAVERDILRRSVSATKRFAAAQVLPPGVEKQQLRELRRDIKALSDADCQKVADLIPLR